MANILVVDDEEMVRTTLRQMLENADYGVIEAANGGKAMRALEEHDVDLVITDILMPEMEGIETIIELKEHMPDLKIIAISGGGRAQNVDYLSVAKELGANATLAKPFRREQVLSIIKQTLEQAD